MGLTSNTANYYYYHYYWLLFLSIIRRVAEVLREFVEARALRARLEAAFLFCLLSFISVVSLFSLFC